MVYNGYYKVMSNIPKMGHLPTPDITWYNNNWVLNKQGGITRYPAVCSEHPSIFEREQHWLVTTHAGPTRCEFTDLGSQKHLKLDPLETKENSKVGMDPNDANDSTIPVGIRTKPGGSIL